MQIDARLPRYPRLRVELAVQIAGHQAHSVYETHGDGLMAWAIEAAGQPVQR